MTIRRMHTGDIQDCLRLCRLSGWNQMEEDWRAFLEAPGGGGRIAVSGSATTGTVTYLRYGACFSWLSMMLVHPDARRAGTGSLLVEAALEALENESCVRLDATPLGEPLYRRFGFQEEFALLRAKVTVPAGGSEPASGDTRAMQVGDLAAVFARDGEVFGADRSALLRSFYDRAPRMARTMYRGETLAGYCFGRPGYLYRQLGPVVAEDLQVAQELVAGCLASHAGETIAVDVPQVQPEWIAWLETAGFHVERPFVRMSRGPAQPPGPDARQFLIAGPEFG